MRKLASIRRIGEVRAIEGADAIEAVQIDGWQCVAKKGEFKAGDLCCYFEIDSFLPTTNPAFEFMAVRGITKDTGVTVDDVAKRLIDYGFHAPTMSFPVAGTLMVEPTESESLEEIDAFCDAMIAIRAEIGKVGSGQWSVDDNPLRGAPHTTECLVGEWDHPYSREEAVFPNGLPSDGARVKVWPSVRRIDGAFGDRNLVCSCPPIAAFAD